MGDRTRAGYLAAALLLLPATAARAQDGGGVSATVEATTDHRRRGLSWSDGEAALDASVALAVAGGLRVEGRATTLRGSPRHGGADAALDASVAYTTRFGGWSLTAGATGHAFPGERGLHYGELDASLGYLIGPIEVEALASYAPDQSAIGGDNLHLAARATASLPGTPWSLSAHVGRTSGGADDPLRAARLRPAGSYTDWGLRLERVTQRYAVGVRYTGTDIRQGRITPSPFADRENSGDRVSAHVAAFF